MTARLAQARSLVVPKHSHSAARSSTRRSPFPKHVMIFATVASPWQSTLAALNFARSVLPFPGVQRVVHAPTRLVRSPRNEPGSCSFVKIDTFVGFERHSSLVAKRSAADSPMLRHLAQPFDAAGLVLRVSRKAHGRSSKVAGTFHVPWPVFEAASLLEEDAADGTRRVPATVPSPVADGDASTSAEERGGRHMESACYRALIQMKLAGRRFRGFSAM